MSRLGILVAVVLLVCATAAAQNNPVPTVDTLIPSAARAGSDGFTLLIYGSNFVSGSVVRWNGSDRPTAFANATQLTATISAADIATPGTASVSVFNPAPGGGISNALPFVISAENPVPTIDTLTPSAAASGSGAFTLTVFGSNLVAGAVVRWNGSDRPTTFVNNTQVTASISAADVSTPGTVAVTVANPAPGGGPSNALSFTVSGSNPAPSISGLSPSSAVAGSSGFTLTVSGSNFIGNSVVRWNGSDRPTAFLSATQLSASIAAADIASAGTATVTVFTPAPGGGTSAGLTFTITTSNPVPSISSLSPSSAPAGGAAFTLTVVGSNFVPGSVVRWNGAARPTTFSSSTQLAAAIAAADIAAAGTAQVSVFNPAPGGGSSANLSFTIGGAAAPAITSLSPASATAGGVGFTLTVNGANFTSGMVVRWNGQNRATAFVSASQLTATIPATDIAATGSISITVADPATGASSNALPFTINPAAGNPVPVISALTPTGANRGGAAFTLTVTGSNFVPGSVVRWNGADRPTTFASATQLTAGITAADIAAVATASVTVFNPAPGGGTSNAVSFAITEPRPAINAGGIVNAASFAGGTSVAPGIVSLFGTNLARRAASAATVPLPTTLEGATVRVNGIAAPLFYVSPTQINFQMPWELLTATTASVVVTVDGTSSSAENIAVARVAPAIFTMTQSGSGQAAAQIANTAILAAPTGSVPGLNSRPANRGEYITIYCTSLGDVSNRPANGAAALASPLSETPATPLVTVGGVTATVVFAGLAPNFVALYQVNAQVPMNAPAGNAVELLITVDGVRSNPTTIAVQ